MVMALDFMSCLLLRCHHIRSSLVPEIEASFSYHFLILSFFSSTLLFTYLLVSLGKLVCSQSSSKLESRVLRNLFTALYTVLNRLSVKLVKWMNGLVDLNISCGFRQPGWESCLLPFTDYVVIGKLITSGICKMTIIIPTCLNYSNKWVNIHKLGYM